MKLKPVAQTSLATARRDHLRGAQAACLFGTLAAFGLLLSAVGGCTGDSGVTGQSSDALTQNQCNFFAVNGKVTLCHSGNGKHYTGITVAFAGCLNGHAGHSADYIAPAGSSCASTDCYPVGAPKDANVPCCSGLVETDGQCAYPNECLTNNGGCAQSCTSIAGHHTCSCNSGYTLAADGKACTDVNECLTDNGGCGQNCTNFGGGYTCSCNAGYALAADGKACGDIDECLTNNGGCAQVCTNTAGSHTCSCDWGHSLNSDGRTCSDLVDPQIQASCANRYASWQGSAAERSYFVGQCVTDGRTARGRGETDYDTWSTSTCSHGSDDSTLLNGGSSGGGSGSSTGEREEGQELEHESQYRHEEGDEPSNCSEHGDSEHSEEDDDGHSGSTEGGVSAAGGTSSSRRCHFPEATPCSCAGVPSQGGTRTRTASEPEDGDHERDPREGRGNREGLCVCAPATQGSYQLSGTVYSTGSAPQAGLGYAQVAVVRGTAALGVTPVTTVTTDRAGQWGVNGIPPGVYGLRIDSYASRTTEVNNIVVTAGAGPKVVDMQVPPALVLGPVCYDPVAASLRWTISNPTTSLIAYRWALSGTWSGGLVSAPAGESRYAAAAASPTKVVQIFLGKELIAAAASTSTCQAESTAPLGGDAADLASCGFLQPHCGTQLCYRTVGHNECAEQLDDCCCATATSQDLDAWWPGGCPGTEG